MEKNWEIVFSSPNTFEAEIIKQMLEENGIQAVLINKHDSSYQTFGEAEVFVNKDNLKTALELINSSNK